MRLWRPVPLQCGEGPDYKSFRIGLFGLGKLHNIPRSVENFAMALDRVIAN
jgi:aspartate aminotransferase-like enzyme